MTAGTTPDMLKAVFDANVLVSAFLSREKPGGATNQLLRFAVSEAIDLYLSVEIIDEAAGILLERPRLRRRYQYSPDQVGQYRSDLLTLAAIIDDPTPMPGSVPRDPDDDKIIACAAAAGAEYLVTRDLDLLSLGRFETITMISPEDFLPLVRASQRRP